jgi:hypothetical protein
MNVDEGVDVVYDRAVKLSGQRLTALARALYCHLTHMTEISVCRRSMDR